MVTTYDLVERQLLAHKWHQEYVRTFAVQFTVSGLEQLQYGKDREVFDRLIKTRADFALRSLTYNDKLAEAGYIIGERRTDNDSKCLMLGLDILLATPNKVPNRE